MMVSVINFTYGITIQLLRHELNFHIRRKGLGERYIIAKGNSIGGVLAL